MRSMTIQFGISLVLVAVVSQCAQAYLIKAESKADVTHPGAWQGDSEDECSWWDKGNFRIRTDSSALNCKGEHDEDPQNVPETPKTDLEGMPQQKPDTNEHQSGANWSHSDSKVTSAWGWGIGTAYWSEDWINEYHFYVESNAGGQFGDADDPEDVNGLRSEGEAHIHDPFAFGWEAQPGETFVLHFLVTLEAGTTVSASADDSWGNVFAAGCTVQAGFLAYSELDFGNDGNWDQLFWSLSVGWDNGSQGIDLQTGPNVSIAGGATEDQVENDLAGCWVDDDTFLVTQDYSIDFMYEVDLDVAGEMAYSFGMEADGLATGDKCACPGDIDGDGYVNIEDLFLVLSAWGMCDDCPEDLNNDGVVNILDVFEVLANWGPCP